MSQPSVARESVIARESVRIRYKGAETWQEACVAFTVNPEMLGAPVMGSSGPKDYLHNHLLEAFATGARVDGKLYRYGSITVLVLNSTPFTVFRIGDLQFDCTGREVEVERV